MGQPKAVVFDVVETLMSLQPLRIRLTDVGLAAEALERWFDRTLRDGMALTLAGDYRPFPAVAAEALRILAHGRIGDEAVAHVMAGFDQLPAQPDAEPAMRTLCDAGISMACLSNGTAESTVAFLDRNGLSRYISDVVAATAVDRWKPARQLYDHALGVLGRPAEEVALAAVHAFDCHGAKRRGWTTGWSSRLEGHYAEIFLRADVAGIDLEDVATKLVNL